MENGLVVVIVFTGGALESMVSMEGGVKKCRSAGVQRDNDAVPNGVSYSVRRSDPLPVLHFLPEPLLRIGWA